METGSRDSRQGDEVVPGLGEVRVGDVDGRELGAEGLPVPQTPPAHQRAERELVVGERQAQGRLERSRPVHLYGRG